LPTPLGAPSLMARQPMIYTQPGLRTSNPSTPPTRDKAKFHVEVPKQKDSESDVKTNDDLSTA
ncbi:hypothetical protein Cadr_000002430, partial [Camelus dromedarius]